ncbi:MAG: hypothetical protein LW632_11810 [Burkholderiaceae bacterium]|nr:hypothetical protein [Burkholderiaceae bacterium]
MPFKEWPFAFGGGALDASVASCCMYAAISLSIVSMFAMNMGFITNTLERLSLLLGVGLVEKHQYVVGNKRCGDREILLRNFPD